jgi:uncharacterized protein
MRDLEAIDLAADELEAMRLTDLEGLYQEQAAEQMGVSRQTLGLILKRAHKKVAEALVLGKAICVEKQGSTCLPKSDRSGCCRQKD